METGFWPASVARVDLPASNIKHVWPSVAAKNENIVTAKPQGR